MASVLRIGLMFLATAIAELVGCYLPYRWLRKGGSAVAIGPGSPEPCVFAWLLTLHPDGDGSRLRRIWRGLRRDGGVLALGHRWRAPSRWDLLGVLITLVGMAIIMFGSRVDGG